LVLKEKEQG